MVSSLRIALLGLGITTLLSTSRAQEPALVPVPAPDSDVKTELKLGNPMIKGTGPYTVTIEGTASLSKDEKECNGISATITRQKLGGATYVGGVSLPKGDPAPGMPAVPVKFTWSVPSKGAYAGTAKMMYTNAKGELTPLQAPIAQFEIK